MKSLFLERWLGVLREKSALPAIYAPDGEKLRTFADIETESASFAERLRVHPPGSVIAIRAGNKPSWPARLLACIRLRLIPLPLGESAGADWLEPRVIPPIPGERRPEFLKLTSGTTAAPRAIRFHLDQLVADCDNICETMGIASGDLNFGVIPFSHSYGFSNLMTPLLCRGVPLVASEDRLPRAILSGLEQTGATVLPGMPVFYRAFAGMENVPALPSLRLCISAGAPLTKSAGLGFSGKFHRKIHSFYGASECGGIAYDRSEDLDYDGNLQPMRNVQITPLESSMIEVRSAAVGDGYFPETDPSVLGQGRFIPGDLVAVHERGMSLEGRVSDIINVAGRKLNPLEVEARLAEFPGVREAVVFGTPSPLRNEEPVACVVAENGCAAGDLLRFCHERLSAWQTPKDIWLVERIPSNERGKVSRRELARLYAERRR